jgi:hypothetical protein
MGLGVPASRSIYPAHLKEIRGRKTDPNDAAFLARAGASGMVMGPFVPPLAIQLLPAFPEVKRKNFASAKCRNSGTSHNHYEHVTHSTESPLLP